MNEYHPPRARSSTAWPEHRETAVGMDVLRDCHCRWPLWDGLPGHDALSFCGELPESGSSYCGDHREAARRYKTRPAPVCEEA